MKLQPKDLLLWKPACFVLFGLVWFLLFFHLTHQACQYGERTGWASDRHHVPLSISTARTVHTGIISILITMVSTTCRVCSTARVSFFRLGDPADEGDDIITLSVIADSDTHSDLHTFLHAVHISHSTCASRQISGKQHMHVYTHPHVYSLTHTHT